MFFFVQGNPRLSIMQQGKLRGKEWNGTRRTRYTHRYTILNARYKTPVKQFLSKLKNGQIRMSIMPLGKADIHVDKRNDMPTFLQHSRRLLMMMILMMIN